MQSIANLYSFTKGCVENCKLTQLLKIKTLWCLEKPNTSFIFNPVYMRWHIYEKPIPVSSFLGLENIIDYVW